MGDNGKYTKEFHSRLFLAWTTWEGRHQRRLSQTTFGEMVGKLRGKLVGQSTVSDWRKWQIPTVEDVTYIAKALECSRCWLAFGDGPGPHDPVLAGQQTIPQPRRR